MIPDDIDMMCDSDFQAQRAEKENLLRAFLTHGALASCRTFKLVDFGAQCPLCSEMLGTNSEELVQHAQDHVRRHDSRQFQCKMCGVDFAYARDLQFHRLSSEDCVPDGSDQDACIYDENDWVAMASDLDRQHRQRFIDGLRRWELRQLHWYLASVAKLLWKDERRKRRHGTHEIKPSRYQPLSYDSGIKMKGTGRYRGPLPSQKSRSEIHYSGCSDTGVTALLQNLKLRESVNLNRTSRDTNASKSPKDLIASSKLLEKSAEDAFLAACADGDVTNAGLLLKHMYKCEKVELIVKACRSAISVRDHAIVRLLLSETATVLRGPFEHCLAAQEQNEQSYCIEHRNIGPLYKVLLDLVFGLPSPQIRDILQCKCDESILQTLRKCCRSDDSPLVVCAMHGEAEAVDFLLKIGDPVDWYQNSDGMTALHSACNEGYWEIAYRLLQFNARVDEPDAFGQIPLLRAIQGRFYDIVKLLLSRNANADPRYDITISSSLCPQLRADAGVQQNIGHRIDEPLLVHICRQRNASTELVEILLQAGSRVEPVDSNGRTAMHWACANNGIDIVQALLDRDADVDAQDETGATPLIQALRQASNESQRELLVLLIRNGADFNARDTITRTPLMWASARGKHHEAEILLRSGAVVDVVTVDCSSKKIDAMLPSLNLARCRRYSALSISSLISHPETQQKDGVSADEIWRKW